MGIPVRQLMLATTNEEFICWKRILEEEEWESRNKTEFYLAQIALEIARGRVVPEDRPKLKLSDFLLTFAPPGGQKPVNPKETANQSKAAWLSWALLSETKKKA